MNIGEFPCAFCDGSGREIIQFLLDSYKIKQCIPCGGTGLSYIFNYVNSIEIKSL